MRARAASARELECASGHPALPLDSGAWPKSPLPPQSDIATESEYPALNPGGGASPKSPPRPEVDIATEPAYPALCDPTAEPKSIDGSRGGFNLFEDLERGQRKHNGPSAEKARERKREEEAALKKVGALVYLGQTVLDAKSGPWYDRDPAEKAAAAAAEPTERDNRKRRRLTDTADPMVAMKAYLKSTSEHRQQQPHRATVRPADERFRREREARAQVAALMRSPQDFKRPDYDPSNYSQSYSHYHDQLNRRLPTSIGRDCDASSARHNREKKEKKEKKKKDKKRKKEKKSKRERD